MSERRLRVLHVITSLAGGAGLHAYQLVRHLDASRFDSHLAFGRGYPLDDRVVAEGLPHFPLGWKRSLDPLATARGTWDLFSILRRERFDIVHAHCSLAGAAGRLSARLLGVPRVLFTVHAFASREHQPAWRRAFYLAIERQLDRMTHHYCVSTSVFRDQLLSRGITTSDKISILPLGIELPQAPDQAARLKARALLGLEPEQLAIGTAGRLEEQKGITYLLRAFRRVVDAQPQARLLILGDGPLRARLESEARELGLSESVRFLGWRNDMETLLPGLDLFCLASLWESFGYVLLEAMAAEVPVVATRVGGIPEVVDSEERGRLVPPNDASALAAAMLGLLQDPGERRALAKAGRAHVEARFQLPHMIGALESLYVRLAGASGTQQS